MPRKRADADPSLHIIGKNLAATRVDAGFKLQGLAAQKAGVTQSQLSDWESGKKKPEVTQLVKLAVAYNCAIDDFLAAVNDDYDQIITRDMPINLKRHYEARDLERRRRFMLAVDSTITAAEKTSPTAIVTPEDRNPTGDRSARVRVRRKRKPPK